MSKFYKDNVRCCDSCFKTPQELGMRRFSTTRYKDVRYYLCPVCRKFFQDMEAKETT